MSKIGKIETMSVERFDQIARLLAQGASRRQILKGFAAGLGASLFTAIGLPIGANDSPIAQAAPRGDGTFLPFIKGEGALSICSVASTCADKVFCGAESDNCRCIQSAEGEILCGTVPSCSAQRCTSSADCANLGEGYFCDSVGSGCCGDDEQRCIAPCTDLPPRGNLATGEWTGAITHEGQSIGVRFILVEDSSGMLEGRILMEDPVSKEFLESGEVAGYRDINESTIYLQSESYAFGNFEGENFNGEFVFASFNGEPGLTATIAMQRTAA
jgi:hypothetical protein